MTSYPSSGIVYLQYMSLTSRTSSKVTTAARTPPWSVGLLTHAADSPQEAAGVKVYLAPRVDFGGLMINN
jgi:hypothetical protein